MKELLFVFAAVFSTQTAIASGPGNAITKGDSVKRSAESGVATSAHGVSKPAAGTAPTQLTDAEMDAVAAGTMYMYYGIPSEKNFFKTLEFAGGPHGPITRTAKGVSQTIP